MSDIFFRWDSTTENTYDRYLLQEELTFISAAIGDASPSFRILEVGCGSGRITSPLIERGFTVVALDYDSAPLRLLSQKSLTVRLTNGHGQNLPFDAESFDCVVAIQSLLNFDPYRFLAESQRVLKNNSLLIHQFLNQHSYKWLLKRLTKELEWASPTSYLKPRHFLQSTVQSGFRSQSIRGYSWPPTVRSSNSNLIGLESRLEKNLQLDRLTQISPWLLVAARKTIK